MGIPPAPYAARLNIDYPERLDRLTMFIRVIRIIPIAIIMSLLTATGNDTVVTAAGEKVVRTSGGISGGLWLATLLDGRLPGAVPALMVRLRPCDRARAR